MNRLISVLSLGVVLAVPFVAIAQTTPNAPNSAIMSPDQMAKAAQIRADSKATAIKAISPAHATAVQAIVDQLNAGKIADMRAGITQIDALLSPEETAALGAIGTKMRADIRALTRPFNANQSSPAPSEQRGEGLGRGRPMDAGLVLLSVLMTPDQLNIIQTKAPPAPRPT